MKFTKMHGCGNDYIYINGMEDTIKNPSWAAVKLSDRHFGIGSDGLILIEPSLVADFKMRMFNADGSEGRMCGNGIRCVAKFVYDNGLTDQESITIETKAGIKYLELFIVHGRVDKVKVDMGEPVLDACLIPVRSKNKQVIKEPITVWGKEYEMTCVSMGNPHAVVFVDNTEAVDLEIIGPVFEKHERFPDRINTEFVEILDRKNIRMRVWERGSGETLACGTGACASAVACAVNGYTEKEVVVHLLGGDLLIQYDTVKNKVFMTGDAVTVFQGEIEIEQ